MSTVRTVDVGGIKKILLKTVDGNKRVSCSCCAPYSGCCMYPAELLGVRFTWEDLPNNISFLVPAISSTPFTMQRVQPYLYQDPVSLVSWTTYYEASFPPSPYNGKIHIYTQPFNNEQVWGRAYGNSTFGSYAAGDRCLLEESPQGIFYAEDEFEDSYTLTRTTFINGVLGTVTGTLIRQSLCLWQGELLIGSNIGTGTTTATHYLGYDGFSPKNSPLFPDDYTWTIGTFFETATKIGFQNSPMGSYDFLGTYQWTIS